MTDEKNIPDDTQPTSSADTGDQLERADEEAARAAAAAEEAVTAAAEAEAAADAGSADADVAEEAGEAAEEAVEAAAEAEEAAEAAAEAPKPKRARKARAAEVAADEAEDAADEAVEAAEKAPDAQPTPSAGTAKPKRSRTRKTEEPAEEPQAPVAAPTRKRDQRREAPVGVEVRAQARYVRTSARKARLVCDHIRGKDVAQARAILAFTPRAVAKDWAKLLESAVANAEHNHELVGEELKITSVYADEGPTLKRFRPRAMGRATRIRKRTSHLTITLTPKEH